MNIPDKAIEAVEALALQDAHEAEIDFDYDDLDGLHARIRKTLEAAAPFIAAQAIRDAVEDLEPHLGTRWPDDEFRKGIDYAQEALRDRADDLDPQ